jgi:hypothetical protein
MLQALQTDTEKRDVSSQTSTAQIVSVTTGTTNAGDATLTRREAIPIEEAEKKMRHAWAAGIVVGIVTTALTAVVLGFAEGGAVTANGVTTDVWSFFRAALFFVLSFFIWWRRSMFAAVMMFTFFLLDTLHMGYQVAMASELPSLAGVVRLCVALAFLDWFFEGARGAVRYHRLQQENAYE